MFPLGEICWARSSPCKAQASPAGADPPGTGTTAHQPARIQPRGHPPALGHPWGHWGGTATQGAHATSPVTSRAPVTTAQAWFRCEFCTGNCPDSANLFFPNFYKKVHTWNSQPCQLSPQHMWINHHTQILFLFNHDLRFLLQ